MIKSILMILMMNFIMTVIINVTNVVMQQVDYAFGGEVYNMETEGKEIVFTEEDYATIARIYNTIGNYAMNSSYDSRLNINSCYNEIREDMLLLDKKGYFEYDYVYDANGELGASWQSVLVPIARARSLKTDIYIDEYNAGLVEAIVDAMEILQSGVEFRPLQVYSVPPVATVDGDTRLDVIVMLTGTMSAAENEKYNENASIFDTLRQPYLSEEKDIHDIETVETDFNMSAINYLLIIICAVFLGYQMIYLAVNAVARIFNMLLLYLAFPPIMAASSLDDGGKRKQWTTAFVVQCLSIFAAVMAMRLVTFCVPIIYSDSLNLFPDSSLSGQRDYIVKLFFLIAVVFTANKAMGMLSGILADSAGYQSTSASNIGDTLVNDLKSGFGNAKGIANFITGNKKKENQKQQENKENEGRKDGGSGGKLSSGGSNSGGHGASPTNHSQLGGGSDTMDKGKEGSALTNTDTNLSNLQNNDSISMGNDIGNTNNNQGNPTEPQNLNNDVTGNTNNNQGNPTEPQNLNNNVTGNTNKNDGNHVNAGRGNVNNNNANNNNANNQDVNRGVQQVNLPQNNVINHQEGDNTNRQNVANDPPVKRPPINLHNMQ